MADFGGGTGQFDVTTGELNSLWIMLTLLVMNFQSSDFASLDPATTKSVLHPKLLKELNLTGGYKTRLQILW